MAYNKNFDYSGAMNRALAKKDYATAAQIEQERNQKIAGEGLNYAPTNNYIGYLPAQYLTGVQAGNLTNTQAENKNLLSTSQQAQIDALTRSGQGAIDTLNRNKPVIEQNRTEGIRTADNQFATASNDYGLARERSHAMGGGMSEYLKGNAYNQKVNALGNNENNYNTAMRDLGYKVADTQLANGVNLANTRASQATQTIGMNNDQYNQQDNLFTNAYNRAYQTGRDNVGEQHWQKTFDYNKQQDNRAQANTDRSYNLNLLAINAKKSAETPTIAELNGIKDVATNTEYVDEPIFDSWGKDIGTKKVAVKQFSEPKAIAAVDSLATKYGWNEQQSLAFLKQYFGIDLTTTPDQNPAVMGALNGIAVMAN